MRRARCSMPASPFSQPPRSDRKSTRLNSSHTVISYAVFCLKKKNEFLPAVGAASEAIRQVDRDKPERHRLQLPREFADGTAKAAKKSRALASPVSRRVKSSP